MKPFRQRLNDYKLTISGMSSLPEDSLKNWLDKYANKGGGFNPGDFLPGKIYTFEYRDELTEKKKFINKRPVVFFMGFNNLQNKLAFSGIDLILMPPQLRLLFLERIETVYGAQIEKNVEKILEDSNDQIALKTDFETVNSILSGIPFKNTYRYWNIDKIRDVKEISYEDWTKIVYLNTRSVEGTTIEEIYKKNIQ
jgi:hypothetical protein